MKSKLALNMALGRSKLGDKAKLKENLVNNIIIAYLTSKRVIDDMFS